MTRCYKCGRVRCETCGGTGCVDAPYSGSDPCCPDCEDGWEPGTVLDRLARGNVTLGTDPAVICDRCMTEATGETRESV